MSDGTGDLVVVFTGRRTIGGMGHGRGVLFEGVAHQERGRLVLLNPAYTLLPDDQGTACGAGPHAPVRMAGPRPRTRW